MIALKFDNRMLEVVRCVSHPMPDLSKEKDHVQVGNAISAKYECYVHNFLLRGGFTRCRFIIRLCVMEQLNFMRGFANAGCAL